MSVSNQHYWPLSSVYFLYFSSLGILIPYMGLYLQSLGFLAPQVGLVFAIIQGTKIIAPNLWAWFSGTHYDKVKMVRIAALFSALTFTFMLVNNTLFSIIIISFLFSFFWNALLPQFEVVTLNLLDSETEKYGNVRLWGSIGFIAAVAGGGWLLEIIEIKYWPILTVTILALLLLASLLVSSTQTFEEKNSQISMFSLLNDQQIIAFFVLVFLIQASHGPYYAFFSISLDDLGYSKAQVGQFWSLGVVAEIILFMTMYLILKHLSLRTIFLLSVFLTVIRWLMIGWFLDNIVILIMAQILHAASFGAFHLVCIQFVHWHFKGSNQVNGQALYSSIGFGAGGMFGSLMAGYFWERIGYQWVFTIAALISLFALFIAWKYVHFNCSVSKRMVDTGRFQE